MSQLEIDKISAEFMANFKGVLHSMPFYWVKSYLSQGAVLDLTDKLCFHKLKNASDGVVFEIFNAPQIDINKKVNGISVLEQVMQSKDLAGLKLLLQHPKIDVNAVDEKGISPLMRAVLNDWEMGTSLLLSYPKTKIEAINNGKTAFDVAKSRQHPDVYGLFLLHEHNKGNPIASHGINTFSILKNSKVISR